MNFDCVGAVLVFSDEPERLVAFYRDVIGIPLEEEKHGGASPHWGCQIGTTHFAIHNSRLNRGRPGIGFSLMTRGLNEQLDRLAKHGVRTHAPIDMGNGARRSSIQDPDGNTVSLIQPSEDWTRGG